MAAWNEVAARLPKSQAWEPFTLGEAPDKHRVRLPSNKRFLIHNARVGGQGLPT